MQVASHAEWRELRISHESGLKDEHYCKHWVNDRLSLPYRLKLTNELLKGLVDFSK